MMRVLKTIFDLFKQTFLEWNEDRAPRLAAALAYYTAFSLAPLLVIVIAIVGFIFTADQVRDNVISFVAENVGGGAADLVAGMVDAVSQPRQGIIATVLGVGTLLFGAMGAFGQLKGALDVIWDVEDKPQGGSGIINFLRNNLLNFGMILFIGFLLLISLVVTTVMSALNGQIGAWLGSGQVLLQIGNFVLSFVVITVLFAMVYKFLPNVELAWRDVIIGAAFTTVLFLIGRFVLTWYLGNTGTASAYGAAGSFVLILLWIYYSAQIILFGAEFTQVFARRYGSEGVRRKPEPVTLTPGRVPPSRAIVPLDPQPRAVGRTKGGAVGAVLFAAGVVVVSLVSSLFGGRAKSAS